MRKLSILLILVILSGCTTSTMDFNKSFESAKNRINETRLPVANNFNKGLFSYYLPQDIGVLESNNISSVLISDDVKIFMSVNVSSVMSDKERKTSLNEDDFELIETFELEGRKGAKPGIVYIENLLKDNYLLYVSVDDVFFFSSVRKADIPNTLEKVLLIGRSLEIDKPAIVAEFSNKETFSFEKEVIELFSDNIPEEGMIKDIIIEEAGD